MHTLLICWVFLLNSILTDNATANSHIQTDLSLTNCECITKWSITDIDCAASNINTLQSYLTLHSFNCLEICHENNVCQQSFSLLTQYYNNCPLGSVSQDIISAFNNNSTCNLCKIDTFYNNNYLQQCLNINCTATYQTPTLLHSIDDIELNCNENITDECNTQCQNNWHIISSHQRQCQPYPLDYLFDIQPSLTQCQTDCNVQYDQDQQSVISSTHKFDFVNNCPNYYVNYTALDLTELEKLTKLCFYGLNIQQPTSYDLICVARQNLNASGIISYKRIKRENNNLFWSLFANALDMDIVWILLCGALVFFMQLGFTLLEGGHVKAGNVQNIMFKNIMDAAICAIVYWIVGYCVAYGDPTSRNANGFMGVENILIENENFHDWFFQSAFACTASTIVSGAVAERFLLEPYFIYTIVVSSWTYPIVVHWIWSSTGWLSPFNDSVLVYGGAIDFAGSSCVHMIGGFLGLCGAYFVGPRLRRFDKSLAATKSKYHAELQHQFEFGHNVPFQVVGLFFLWFGFYGFNCGSTLQANNSMDLASKIAVNTTISAASGGLTSALLARMFHKSWHIPKLCNGILAALASITASCAVVSPGVSIFIGCVGSALYYLVSKLMVSKYVQIDDPLDAFAVHGIGGIWGVFSAGLFATNESLKFANYPASLYAETDVGQRFATNLLLIFVVAGWTLVNGILLFGTMGYLKMLRVSEKMERSGIDVVEHGGHALNMRKTYAVSVKSTLDNKRKHYGKKKQNEDVDDDGDGNFANKIRESSLERRLQGVADVDEHGVFPT